jgi:hypothetical protein
MSLNVDPQEFEFEWARVAPWLEDALEQSRCIETLEDVKQAVIVGTCQLFTDPDGAAVTLVARIPTLRIWLAGGAMEGMERAFPAVEAFAIAAGLQQVAFLGRTGWQRSFLTKIGFKAVAVDMVKTLVPLEVPDGQANDH